MKVQIRFRDEQGRLVSAREEKPSTPISILTTFSIALLIIGIILKLLGLS